MKALKSVMTKSMPYLMTQNCTMSYCCVFHKEPVWMGKFIHTNCLYLDKIPSSCCTWRKLNWADSFKYPFVHKWVQQPNSVSLHPFVPHLFQSLCQWLYHHVSFACAFYFLLLLYSQDKNKLTVSQGRESEWEKSWSRLCFSLQFSLSWCSLFFKCLHWSAQGLKQAGMYWTNDTFKIAPYFHLSCSWIMPRKSYLSTGWITEEGLFLRNRLVRLSGFGWAPATNHMRTHPKISRSFSP